MILALYKKIFEEKWPSELGGILLALLNILMFWYSGSISTTTAVIAKWARWLYKVAFLDIFTSEQVTLTTQYYPHSVLYIGLMSGVLLSALFARQFSIKKEGIGGYLQGFIGGALMGIGSFLAGSCILGGFYSGIMELSLSGFVMMAGLLAGAFFGGKTVMWQINREAERSFNVAPCHSGTEPGKSGLKKDYRHIQPKIALAGVLLLIAITSRDIIFETGFPTAAFIFGVIFGVVVQRSAFCFAGAFREIFLTKTTRMMRSLIISLVVGAIGFSLIMISGHKPMDAYVFQTSWRVLIGSMIFGFGMVITGG